MSLLLTSPPLLLVFVLTQINKNPNPFRGLCSILKPFTKAHYSHHHTLTHDGPQPHQCHSRRSSAHCVAIAARHCPLFCSVFPVALPIVLFFLSPYSLLLKFLYVLSWLSLLFILFLL